MLPRTLAEAARRGAPGVWRRMPLRIRKRSRYIEPFNRLVLRLAARPLAIARMRAGHRLLLDLRSGTEWPSYYTGEFDDDRIAVARHLLRRSGSVAVDAGANIGLWSVPLARWAARRGGRVIAVEPVSANAERLRQNLRLNGVEDAVEVRRVALSDRSGVAAMSLREDFAMGAGTGNAAVVINDGGDVGFPNIDVEAVPLDDLLRDLGSPPVDVLKADLEGHEDRFLAGAMNTFTRSRPVAFLEWNRTYYRRRRVDATASTRSLLRELRYRCLRRERGRWVDDEAFASPREIDDVVLAPAERAPSIRALLQGSARRR